mgnify:CR=1 FL=1
MGSGLYSIGLSGLQSSNARINTTGQNTANVDTEGYSRQKTSTVSSPTGAVRIQDTSRIVDKFVNDQVRTDTSSHSYYDTYHSMMSTADGLLGENSVSLNNYLNKAFKSLHEVNNDPTSSSLRELAHSSLKDLTQHYHTLSKLVGEQKTIADKQTQTSLGELNNLTRQVAHLNSQILQEETGSTSPANELRDQQELLAKDIASYVNVKVQYADNGVMTVHLGSGQPLVMDKTATVLKAVPDPSNPSQKKLFIDFGKYDVAAKTEHLGGSIGALVDYQAEFAEKSDRELGLNAISIADAMNQQNGLGLDAGGAFGKDLFKIGDIKVYADAENKGEADNISVQVSPGSSADVALGNYELSKTDDNQFTVKVFDLDGKLSQKAAVLDVSTAQADKNGNYQLDGLGVSVHLGDLKDYELHDKYRFSPADGAASGVSLAAKNGDDIALSAPLGVKTNPNNLSDASLSVTSVTNTDPSSSAFSMNGELYPVAPHSIYFTSDNAYEVRDEQGNVLSSVNDAQDFKDLLAKAGLAEEAGFDVSISSAPKAGDEFSMSMGDLGPADNFNGLQLADLQNRSLVSGKTTLAESFSDLVTSVGSKSAALDTNRQSSEVVMNQSMARRDEVSSVSLDEEAVNLLKYQQSYSAAAQVITAARTTFDALLGAVR